MSHYLKIFVTDENVFIQYTADEEVVMSRIHNFGIKHLESQALNAKATAKFLDSIMHALELISLYERIPTDFRLITPRYATWLKSAIENYHYSQFFTDGVSVRVTLEDNKDNLFDYAGHKKAKFSFKI